MFSQDIKNPEARRLRSASRFGSRSNNMFFARNVAHPHHLRLLKNITGSSICSLNQHEYVSPTNPNLAAALITDPRYHITFPLNSFNETLLRTYAASTAGKNFREDNPPPPQNWTEYGVVVEDQASRWKDELSNFANSIGILTSNDVRKHVQGVKINPFMTKMLHEQNSVQPTRQHNPETGRFCETPAHVFVSRTAKSRSSSGQKRNGPNSMLYCIDPKTREVWMIQILSQILQTQSMDEIKNWLVSANDQEKTVAKDLIEKALTGLEETDRVAIERGPYEYPYSKMSGQIDFAKLQSIIDKISASKQPSLANTMKQTSTETAASIENQLLSLISNDEPDYEAPLEYRPQTGHHHKHHQHHHHHHHHSQHQPPQYQQQQEQSVYTNIPPKRSMTSYHSKRAKSASFSEIRRPHTAATKQQLPRTPSKNNFANRPPQSASPNKRHHHQHQNRIEQEKSQSPDKQRSTKIVDDILNYMKSENFHDMIEAKKKSSSILNNLSFSIQDFHPNNRQTKSAHFNHTEVF